MTVRPNHLGAALQRATAVPASSKTAISAGTCCPEAPSIDGLQRESRSVPTRSPGER
jgi:hypothetical protein